jgi:PAS domain S-box-containing protein
MAGIFDVTNIAAMKTLSEDDSDEILVSQLGQMQNSDTFAKSAFGCMKEMEILQLFDNCIWLCNLIAAVEYLPIGFSISTANPKCYGYPFIYVNKQFEYDSGYSRDRIIGKNGKLLQGPKTSATTIERIGESLSKSKPIRATLTNYCADGSTYRDHMALKPLFDQYGKVRYVIGLHFTSKSSASAEITPLNTHLLDRLMSILPNNIIVQSKDG